MRTKKSLVGLEARDKVIDGANYLADCVKSTIGPYGYNVLLEKGNRPTNDGYTISAELASSVVNEFERRGALALHEASSKTNDEVGDATSSAECLAQAIIKESLRFLPSDKNLVARKKPSEVLQMIETSKNNVIELLKAQKTLVTTVEELIASAKVSVENEELAKMIGETQFKIGPNGFILAEDTIEPTSSIQIVKGIRIDNGFAFSNFMTDQSKQQTEVGEIKVLLTNYTIDEPELQLIKTKLIDPLIQQHKKGLTIIARAFTPKAIQICNETINRGFLLWALNAPYTDQHEVMKDLACITGAQYYDQEEKRFEDITTDDLGFATRILARRFDAVITGVEDNPLISDSIQQRIKELEDKMNGIAVSDFEKRMIKSRIAQFNGGFAILKVGAPTQFEKQYKLDKADDAVNSVRLALQEGTVKGGGLAFKEISEQLSDDDILKRPLLSIHNQILSSAPNDFVIPEWVRDPYLTLVSALRNACSVAGQFACINGVITTEDPPKINVDKLLNLNE